MVSGEITIKVTCIRKKDTVALLLSDISVMDARCPIGDFTNGRRKKEIQK